MTRRELINQLLDGDMNEQIVVNVIVYKSEDEDWSDTFAIEYIDADTVILNEAVDMR